MGLGKTQIDPDLKNIGSQYGSNFSYKSYLGPQTSASAISEFNTIKKSFDYSNQRYNQKYYRISSENINKKPIIGMKDEINNELVPGIEDLM